MKQEQPYVVGIYRDTLERVLGLTDTGYADNYGEILVSPDILRGWYERIGSPCESFEHWMWEYTLDDMEGFLEYCETLGRMDEIEIVCA